jgi:peptidoglycan/xylan/chitin deacetylase (PgdA/CDA1 family)
MVNGSRDFIFGNQNLCRSVYKLKKVFFSTLIISFIISLILFQPLSSVFPQAIGTGSNRGISCNCVVFRMDDVQDSFVDVAQVAAMNIFISKGQPLSLGLIMNHIGNDSKITGKIGEGSQLGLFELGLHGWDHIDYTKLSYSEQRETLDLANKKMKRIFGNISEIFISPYGYFNNNTLKAMNELGIRILSATIYSEINIDRGRSVFNYSAQMTKGLDDVSEKVNNNISLTHLLPFHVPSLISYKNYENGRLIKNPVSSIIDGVEENVEKYGYSVIVFHPQDFAYTDANGAIADKDSLNATEINEFSQLIDTVLSKNMSITTLSEIVGIDNRSYSYFR